MLEWDMVVWGHAASRATCPSILEDKPLYFILQNRRASGLRCSMTPNNHAEIKHFVFCEFQPQLDTLTLENWHVAFKCSQMLNYAHVYTLMIKF